MRPEPATVGAPREARLQRATYQAYMTDTDWLDRGIERALVENADAVERWRRGEAGAWGHIAGQAVMACWRELGRSLTHPERRLVWAAAWAALTRGSVVD